MKHLKLTATFFMVILLGLTTTAQRNSRWLSYEPAIVELEGRLTVQWKYGPPNYGVKGTLFHALSGHHYTDVVMDVGSIETRQKRSP
jgi:hypothetical protein